MTGTDRAASLAGQLQARDTCNILAPWLFREPALADLRELIEARGVAAVELAVRNYLARSRNYLTRSVSSRGYVRSWRFFKP